MPCAPEVPCRRRRLWRCALFGLLAACGGANPGTLDSAADAAPRFAAALNNYSLDCPPGFAFICVDEYLFADGGRVGCQDCCCPVERQEVMP